MTQPTIPERFAARRAELLDARHAHFWPGGLLREQLRGPDFAPFDGYCLHRNIHKPGEPRCGFDLVAHFGEDYPTMPITGCPKCSASYCE